MTKNSLKFYQQKLLQLLVPLSFQLFQKSIDCKKAQRWHRKVVGTRWDQPRWSKLKKWKTLRTRKKEEEEIFTLDVAFAVENISNTSFILHWFFNWCLNDVQLFLNSFCRFSSQIFQRFNGVWFSSFWDVKMRWIRHEIEGGDEDDWNDETDVLVENKRHKRSNAINVKDSNDYSNLHEASQSSTTIIWCDLTDVHRLCCHDKSHAKTLKQSRDINLWYTARENEKNIGENVEHWTAQKCPFSANHISHWTSDEWCCQRK